MEIIAKLTVGGYVSPAGDDEQNLNLTWTINMSINQPHHQGIMSHGHRLKNRHDINQITL